MNELAFGEVLHELGPGVLDTRARQDGRARAGAFERGTREAGQKLLRAHVRQEGVRADRFAGDARDDAAVRAVLTARKDIAQDRTGDLVQGLPVEVELALLGDEPDDVPLDPCMAVGIVRCTRGNADVLTGEGKNEQGKKSVLLDRRTAERFVQRIGANVADHLVSLARHVWPWLRHRGCVVTSGRGALGLLVRLRDPIGDGLDLATAVEIHADVVGFTGLAIHALSLRRQFRLAPLVDLDDGATLRQMIGHPFVLGAEKGLDVGRIAAVLVGRREQVLLPDDAVGLGEIIVEARIARVHPGARQSPRDVIPGDGAAGPSSAYASSRPRPVPRRSRQR